ncbi:ABC transporter ATP-binding protein [Neobacillus niacini]|uniref:ABC transporter ATP-binding protein n=1 Tax=Neobacillus niacini TaxID=86668 RepID=UPI0021CB503E|nr:ABC transporter ATP-binding protein [Neobacillus niacini]MCM3764661.1 ABC transporter ATP-binding protein [Neobacillus niacini]
MDKKPLLEIKNLSIGFKTLDGSLNAIEGINFKIMPGESVALVGESGCGKSVTSLAIMGLLANNAQVSGEINLNGNNILNYKEPAMRKVRGNDIAMIFQEPMTALNPVLRIGDQISEPLRLHQKLTKSQIRNIVLELLDLVGIPNPKLIEHSYLHQLSGGMRQRVMIAMAMACNPKLLIADEPTTALDVTVQAQILDLLKNLQRDHNMALLLITHDLGVVAEMCDRATIMYAGKVVEEGTTSKLFNSPEHPYTKGLLSSIPKLTGERERLKPIRGNVPSLTNMPIGCRFAPRCDFAMDVCTNNAPSLATVDSEHRVSCWMNKEAVGE